jgi:hypothetical protein
MEKEFVPYELAVKLKALGFNEECFGAYHNENYLDLKSEEYDYSYAVKAPLFQQAFRWFREKHGLFSSCDISNFVNKTYGYVINSSNPPYYLHNVHNLKSIEEAEIACLTKLIEIVEKESFF